MATDSNFFRDRFKFLDTTAAKISTLRAQVERYLSDNLPDRIKSNANIFNLLISVLEDISNLNMYYINTSLTETNILTANRETSIRGLAELTGHKATRPISARGTLKMTILPGLQTVTPVLLLDNLRIRSVNNNLPYIQQTRDRILQVNTDAEEYFIEMIQGIVSEQDFVSSGEDIFVVNLDDENPIENYEIEVWVNSVKYKKYDSLYDMGSTTDGYVIRNSFASQIEIIFGDGVHGAKLNEGESIRVRYLTTEGETGNLTDFRDNAQFAVIGGVYDSNGDEIDISDFVEFGYESGFNLGSNGEHKDTTRQISGYNSRALTFARPENIQAYLSRLSILSNIQAWTEDDDLLFYLLLLPNILPKLTSYSDYLTIDESELTLDQEQLDEISLYINTSRRQFVSTELQFIEPILKRYAMFVYLDADFYDPLVFKRQVTDEISKIMVDATYTDVNIGAERFISKSSIVSRLNNMDDIKRVSINIFSEENEIARINGEYVREVVVPNGSVNIVEEETIILEPTDNPNLGFSEIGDIYVSDREEVPILRSGFQKYNGEELPPVTLDKPIYIFVINENGVWEEI